MNDQIALPKSVYAAMTHELKKRSHVFRVGYANAKANGIRCTTLSQPTHSHYREKMGALIFLFETGVIDNFTMDRRELSITAVKDGKQVFYYKEGT